MKHTWTLKMVINVNSKRFMPSNLFKINKNSKVTIISCVFTLNKAITIKHEIKQIATNLKVICLFINFITGYTNTNICNNKFIVPLLKLVYHKKKNFRSFF